LHEIFSTTHTGRWPVWRSYGMHRDGARLYELVEWVPRRKVVEAARFNVVTWTVSLTGVGALWQRERLTRRAAAALFAQLKRGVAGPAEIVGIAIAR
jgi:hypothetical protein